MSRKKVNPNLEKQVARTWYQLVCDIKTAEEAEKIFKDLFSPTELSAITKRLAVGYWLIKKRSYENIKNNLKVSSATIATVQQGINRPGWQEALKKITADEWATVWEEKIKGIFGKKR